MTGRSYPSINKNNTNTNPLTHLKTQYANTTATPYHDPPLPFDQLGRSLGATGFRGWTYPWRLTLTGPPKCGATSATAVFPWQHFLCSLAVSM